MKFLFSHLNKLNFLKYRIRLVHQNTLWDEHAYDFFGWCLTYSLSLPSTWMMKWGSQCSELEDHDCKDDQLQSTLKLCGICCSGWITTNLLCLMGFTKNIQRAGWCRCKTYLDVFEHSWESREGPAEKKLVNIVPVFKKV